MLVSKQDMSTTEDPNEDYVKKTCIFKLLDANIPPTKVAQHSGHKNILSLNPLFKVKETMAPYQHPLLQLQMRNKLNQLLQPVHASTLTNIVTHSLMMSW